MKYLTHPRRILRHTLGAPFIFSVLTPIVILDLWIEIYHRVCFPLYSLPYISRKKYIKIDRHKLKYLTLNQKLNCLYCGYANGVIAFWVQIAAETEKYWCGIMHNTGDDDFITPEHHAAFAKYADEEDFKNKYST